jgi:sigma-B regulation protein RsbU (phosphoserine phosphatase)
MAFWRKKSESASQRGSAKASGGAAAASASSAGASSGAASPGVGSGPKGASSTQFLIGDAGRDRRSVEVLLEAIARVSESRDLEALVDFVVDSSIEVTGAERGLLVLVGAGGEQLVRVARQEGVSLPREAVKYSTTLVGRVLEELEPIRTTVQSDAEALEIATSVFDLKLRAVMCVPLTAPDAERGDSSPQGALYVDSKAASRAFTPEDLSLFFALAKHIAIALENAHLNQQSLEKVRLEETLNIATEIQSGLMPKVPRTIPGFDVHGWYHSAEHASGDFYDFVPTKDGKLAVVLGDVRGHGIGPALITATAQASLRSYVRVLSDPAAIVRMLNEDLGERMEDGMFLTLFLGLFMKDGAVQVVNAGQTPPLIWRQASARIESVGGDGPAIGFTDDFEYAEGPRLLLAKGDMLLAFTDGLVEARHASRPDRMFGEEGVRAILADAGPRGLGARELTESLVSSVLEFSGGVRDDDMTIVAVRRTE